jgi:hypothetical protein
VYSYIEKKFDLRTDARAKTSSIVEKGVPMNTKKLALALLLFVGMVTTSIDAYAQTANNILTGVFIGIVTASNDPAVPVGAIITGKYTFNYAAGISGYGTGTVGSSNWSVANPGSTDSHWTPAQVAARTVFTTTALSGTFRFSTAQPTGSYEVVSFVAASSPSASAPGYSFYASEESYPLAAAGFHSWLQIDTPNAASQCSGWLCPESGHPWTTAGFPIITAESKAVGGITDALGHNIAYDVFALTPLAEDLFKALYVQVIGVGPGKSLEHKVAAAEAYYAAKDIVATCAMLDGFDDEVQAQSGKKINQKLASALIAEDLTIEGLIGCH